MYSCAAVILLVLAPWLNQLLTALLATSSIPRRFLYQSPLLVWTNVVSSALTAAAYAILFICMLWLASRLRRVAALDPYVWTFITFGVFIGACAISQLMGIITFWWALYRLATVVKVVCAVASVGTTVYLLRMTPRLARNIVRSLDLLSVEQMERDQIEKRLHDSQAKLGFALVASKGIGTWEWDIASNLFRSDATVARIYDVDPERAAAGVLVEEYMQWIGADDVPRVLGALKISQRDGVPFLQEYRISQPGRPAIWVACRGEIIHGADHTPARMNGVVVDITERKWSENILLETERVRAEALRAKEKLRSSEESLSQAELTLAETNGRFRLLVEGLYDHALFTIDADGTITSWNLGAQRLLGYVESDMVGRSIACIFTEADNANRVPEKLIRNARRSVYAEDEGWRVKADGTRLWATVTKSAFLDASGVVAGFAVIVHDTTEKKRAAEERVASATALAGSNARFRLLVEGVSDHALFTIDPVGIVTSWNRGAERLLGHTEEAIVGRSYACIFPTEDRESGVAAKHLERARSLGRAENDGWRVRANGERFWASVSKTAILDESGSISGFAVIIQDTTERKRVANALEEARIERSRLQEKFLSHVSHELRTPLTAIYFFTSNVADGVFGELLPEQHEHLGFALENVKQLKEMVSDLLDITRVDSQKLAVEPQHANPAKLIAEVRITCLRDAREKDVRLLARHAEELPAIWADPARVRQILTNLVENGIKFTPERGSVTIGVRQTADEPGFLRFSVEDTGCGIAPSHLKTVFDRLAQVSQNPELSRSGLGLGLFIASELVGQHGGRIWVESELGLGSTFFFTLPLFSLAQLCAHVLTPRNLALGCATLITVDLVPDEGMSRSELMPEVQKVLSRCVHPGQDVLLPWIGNQAPVMTFFIVACTDDKGFSVIATRIGMELKGFGEVGQLKPHIASTTVTISPALSGERQIQEVTERFERLIETHLQGQEKLQ